MQYCSTSDLFAMGYVLWIFGTVWRYCANVEALVTVCSLAFAYRFLFGGGDAFWEVLDRVIVKLELKMTGHYDRVPTDGESRVSARRTRASWELRRDNVGVFAIQGRRPYMEDRFNVVSQLEHTDTSIYGIFDGHGGEVLLCIACFSLLNISKISKEVNKILLLVL